MGGGTRISAGRTSGHQHTPAPKRGWPQASTTQCVATSAKLGSSPHIPIDLTEDGPAPVSASSRKRKADIEWPVAPRPWMPAPRAPQTSPQQQKRQKKTPDEPAEEKRLRRFRPQEPRSFSEIYDRAMTQRFFVLERRRTGTDECPGEVVELTGSTGNVYTVSIGRRPDCDCPHAKKGNQCKHIVFVMKKVLNAPFNLVYQLALLSSELREIFASAPPIDSPESARDGKDADKRKPIDGDCPICFSELEEKGEAIVWCRAACGQNMHQECFQTWARTKSGSGKVTCPMCRSEWEGADPGAMVGRVEKSRGTVSEGYVNVADQLGISQVRDYSSYSEWFGRSRPGRGGYSGGWGRRYGAWGEW